MQNRTIFITEADGNKLTNLLEARKRLSTLDQEHLWMLEKELDRAEVVNSEDISPDVITMHSQVRIKDLDTAKQTDYTLVFPADADISRNRISVLAPIGTALLGYREGDVIEWRVPGGLRKLRVEHLIYQPEAWGDEPGYKVARHRSATGSRDRGQPS